MNTSEGIQKIIWFLRLTLTLLLHVPIFVWVADVTGWQASYSTLTTRVYSVDKKSVETDVGYLAQRLYGRNWWIRSDVKQRIRVGCIYQLVISYKFSAKIRSYLFGDPGPPYLEQIIGGVEEPERGCVDLYRGQPIPRRGYGKDNRCSYPPSKFGLYPDCE